MANIEDSKLETEGKVEEEGRGDGTSRTNQDLGGAEVDGLGVIGGPLDLVVEEVVEYKCPFESDFYQIGKFFGFLNR